LFFADHQGELGAAVTRGRREEFKSFAAFADPERAAAIPDPQAESTFVASKLDWSELEAPRHARALAIHRAMFELRREDPVIRDGSRRGLVAEANGSALAIVRGEPGNERLCVVNFGDEPVAPFAPAGHAIERARLLVATHQHEGPQIPPRGAAVYALR
jgi:maltooligosyltrehalose trehalohydrolase